MDERNLTDFLDGTTTASTSQEPPNGDVLYKVVATTVYFILGAVAIVGNTMVIIVVLRVKSMRTPTNCHLVSLAFVDAVTGLVPNWLHSIPEVLGNSTWYGAIGCVPMVYVEYLVFNMSAVSIAAFTAERYIAICHPMKSHYMCTINRAVKIIVCVWIFTAIYCVCWLILIDYDETRPNPCYYNTDYEKFLPYVYVADCILFYMIPVGIAIPTYIVIGRALYRSTRSRSKMVASYSRKREDGTTEKAHDKSDAARKQLVIHPGKTAHLVIKTVPNSTDTIHLGTSIISNVNSFMYLGSTITYNTDDTPEISKRIAIAKTTLRECKYLRSPHLSVATKLLVIRALVMSRLTYGSTTWSIKNSDAAKLDAFGRTVWRWLLGVNWSDHVTNESLMRMIDGRWLFTYDTIVQRKMDWFSHIARQQGLQWDLLSGAVLGTVSSRGRPRMTWYDNIRASTGLTMEEAKQQALSRIHLRILVTIQLHFAGHLASL
ncbi:putative thyrotropin-releasing hormone receptor isoform X2 [Apostichopus japonicus]|uniref:Thyrotropin-releasing hormone receptor n=1 Tax=Stichopus japonicus TaxID=307972 RepID=A0A2G8L0X0_STIJA|nr:putative thyrotropin-releasing hormone receptor isoform X2 [Apostichopus japonicus]